MYAYITTYKINAWNNVLLHTFSKHLLALHVALHVADLDINVSVMWYNMHRDQLYMQQAIVYIYTIAYAAKVY